MFKEMLMQPHAELSVTLNGLASLYKKTFACRHDLLSTQIELASKTKVSKEKIMRAEDCFDNLDIEIYDRTLFSLALRVNNIAKAIVQLAKDEQAVTK